MNQLLVIIQSFDITLVIALALLLDRLLGEPKKFHPLIGFGNVAAWFEKKLNHYPDGKHTIFYGALAWLTIVVPLPVAIYWTGHFIIEYAIENNQSLLTLKLLALLFDSVLLYLIIGLTSLKQHAMQIYRPLSDGDLPMARHFTGYLVSRDTSALSTQQMSRATVESMLENGHDAVIASLFYYAIGGIELALIHRLANTLDAMWGYKNKRFNDFGCFTARMDDVLGFVSGKVTVCCYAIQGKLLSSVRNAFVQGNQYKSHNGGWVMAAGATVLNIKLGGSAIYHGKTHYSVQLGEGDNVTLQDIVRSITLVQRASLVLLLVVSITQVLLAL